MPYVRGFLKVGRKNRPGTGGPVDPDYGIEEGEIEGGEGGEIDNELPAPPPGIWPPLNWGHPIQPLPPTEGGEGGEGGEGEHPSTGFPPGAIWPRPPGPVKGLFVAIAHIPSLGWRYVVIDPDGFPERPERPERPPGGEGEGEGEGEPGSRRRRR